MALWAAGFRTGRTGLDAMRAAETVVEEATGRGRVAANFLGVERTKGGQKSNWAGGQLTGRQLAYASDDTRYLGPRADKLEARLAEADKTVLMLIRRSDSTLYVPMKRTE